jgi:hypothetical protein
MTTFLCEGGPGPGAGDVIGMLFGMGLMGYGLHQAIKFKKFRHRFQWDWSKKSKKNLAAYWQYVLACVIVLIAGSVVIGAAAICG